MKVSIPKLMPKFIWSSRSNKFIGHAMTHDELASLSDVYTILKPDYSVERPDFQLCVIGPHYTSDTSFSHSTLCPILMDAIHQFDVCGTVAVVCDGAAPNCTTHVKLVDFIKYFQLIVWFSVYLQIKSIKPCFLSPYTAKNIHYVICPSHQIIDTYLLVHVCP